MLCCGDKHTNDIKKTTAQTTDFSQRPTMSERTRKSKKLSRINANCIDANDQHCIIYIGVESDTKRASDYKVITERRNVDVAFGWALCVAQPNDIESKRFSRVQSQKRQLPFCVYVSVCSTNKRKAHGKFYSFNVNWWIKYMTSFCEWKNDDEEERRKTNENCQHLKSTNDTDNDIKMT